MTLFERIIRHMISSYNTLPGSRIRDLLEVFAEQLDEAHKTNDRVQEWRDIDLAEGATLDRFGVNVQEPRSGRTDGEYRDILKIRVRANLSGGDIETLISVALAYFDTDLISVQEAWNLDRFGNESAAVVITFNDADLIDRVPFEALRRVKAGGVRLYVELFSPENTVLFTGEFDQSTIKEPLAGTFPAGQRPGGVF